MNPFEHINAPNLSTAISLLKKPNTEALAGGTDLLGEMKRGIKEPGRLVNLKTLPGLKRILFSSNLSLGALITLSEIEHHSMTSRKFPILAQAASQSATPQLRNMSTVAGNLCQAPRCWYYRSPLFQCWLKGGKKCFAVNGENRYHAILGSDICHAVHASDLAPALMALDARIKVVGPKGRRQISLEELYTKPTQNHRQLTILRPGELITEVRVPIPSKNSQGIYLKAMERKAWSFALVSVAAQMSFERDHVAEARLVLGGVASFPWRAKNAEEILRRQKLSEEVINAAAEAAVAEARPLRDNQYKVPLVKSLIRQALRTVSNLEIQEL
jgi:xanthine dehydrogenase YagS FAD-binding subunit